MAVINDEGETLALSLPEKILEIEAAIGAMANVLVGLELVDRQTLRKEHARVKSYLEQAMAQARERLCKMDPAYVEAFKAQDEAQLNGTIARRKEQSMLGKIVFRHHDRELAEALCASLKDRYPSKGIESGQDGDLHLIRAAGNTDVVEAFIAGVGWEQSRVAMAETPRELQASLPKGFVDNDHDGMS